ncbi:hypothetical protein RE428_32380 [Marinobacter nanhaiticus D15-8W]|uniref:hypothetical protein n=1 Tax=Marinobacter nanhaiticus TaxID=1305740 RepID=UPI0003A6E093|nr:hypothetical protein [Marinobacter nanhaiticus]BES72220.1 hypothetical protein RE428_32380 [Marinobacter nanhaiticus D15-8W]
MSEHRKNRQQLRRKEIEAILRSGASVSQAAKRVGCSYEFAKLVKGQMEISNG